MSLNLPDNINSLYVPGMLADNINSLYVSRNLADNSNSLCVSTNLADNNSQDIGNSTGPHIHTATLNFKLVSNLKSPMLFL